MRKNEMKFIMNTYGYDCVFVKANEIKKKTSGYRRDEKEKSLEKRKQTRQ